MSGWGKEDGAVCCLGAGGEAVVDGGCRGSCCESEHISVLYVQMVLT